MPAARLSDLPERRRLLVAEADLHRQLIAFEFFNLESRRNPLLYSWLSTMSGLSLKPPGGFDLARMNSKRAPER